MGTRVTPNPATTRAGVRIFSTDLDGTILGDPASAWRFADAWSATPRNARPLLVYNTGRTVANTRALVASRQLPEPDFIIGSVGTEFHNAGSGRLDSFVEQLRGGWDRERIEQIVEATPGVTRQPSTCSHAFKSSWYWVRARRDEIADLEVRIREAALQATIVYSCRYFLDVIPARAGKGCALEWLCRQLGIPTDRVLVAGDTANDTSMFTLPGVRGIVVQNALPELLGAVIRPGIFVAQQPLADGVVEGLRHFDVLPAARPEPQRDPAEGGTVAPRGQLTKTSAGSV